MSESTLSAAELAALPPDSLLSRREVEVLYRISAGTLRNRDAAGRGPVRTSCGREARYSKRNIEVWLAEHSK